MYSMETESIEMFFDTRCKVGDTEEADISKTFYVEADVGFFDEQLKARLFKASKQSCYGKQDGETTR